MPFCRRDLDLDRMFWNVNYRIHQPYGKEFPPNTSMTLGVPKLLSAESVFDIDHPAGVSGRRSLVCPEQNSVMLMAL